ncbi:MAG TPA: hypothetical protein VFX61_05210, partial [Micromonosporaceae bacterium]|nr:hypothetical protein [Micromonosporaceae bacterium]
MASEISTIIDLDDRPDPEDRTLPPPRGRHRLPEPEPRPWSARPRLLAGIAAAIAIVAGALAVFVPAISAGRDDPSRQTAAPQRTAPNADPQKQPTTAPSLALAAAPVTLNFDGFLSWALLDGQG